MGCNSRINSILRRLDGEKAARLEAARQQRQNLESLKSRYRHRAILPADEATELRPTLDDLTPSAPVYVQGASRHGYPVFSFRTYLADPEPEPAWEPMLFGDPRHQWPAEYAEVPPKWHRAMKINTGDFGLMLAAYGYGDLKQAAIAQGYRGKAGYERAKKRAQRARKAFDQWHAAKPKA